MATVRLAVERIDLSQRPAIALGPLEILPRLREVKSPSNSIVLEPRVMRVLVVLGERPGEIIGHEELIARCWDGQIIGDNAIHRVVGRLRNMLRLLEVEDSVAIHTIAKVGYRLVQTRGEEAAAISAPAASDASPAAGPRRPWRFLPFALLLLLDGQPGSSGSGPAAEPVRIAVVGEADPASGVLARELSAELTRVAATQPRRSMTIMSRDGGSAASFRLGVRVTTDNRTARVALDLVDRRSNTVVWARSLDGVGSGMWGQRATAAAASVLGCLAEPDVRAERLDPATLAPFLAACERLIELPDEERVRLLGQVVERRPDFVLARAELAYAQAYLLGLGTMSPTQEVRARRSAATHLAAVHRQAVVPAAAYLAGNLLLNRDDWSGRLNILERGLRADPDDGRLHEHLGTVLSSVGQMGGAITSARRAVELEPYSPSARNTLITALAYTGYIDAAREELSRAQQIWPQSDALRDVGFRFHLRYGDPATALRILNDGRGNMRGPSDLYFQMAAALATARLSPTPDRIDAALNAGRRPNERSVGLAFWQVQALGYFGHVDEAIRLLANPAVRPALRDWPEVLFRIHLRPVRQDPRFMAVMHSLGLVQFWRDTGRWPDFCGDAAIRYDCRREADRLLAAPGGDDPPDVRPNSRSGQVARDPGRSG